jgi:hypothetical protein
LWWLVSTALAALGGFVLRPSSDRLPAETDVPAPPAAHLVAPRTLPDSPTVSDGANARAHARLDPEFVVARLRELMASPNVSPETKARVQEKLRLYDERAAAGRANDAASRVKDLAEDEDVFVARVRAAMAAPVQPARPDAPAALPDSRDVSDDVKATRRAQDRAQLETELDNPRVHEGMKAKIRAFLACTAALDSPRVSERVKAEIRAEFTRTLGASPARASAPASGRIRDSELVSPYERFWKELELECAFRAQQSNIEGCFTQYGSAMWPIVQLEGSPYDKFLPTPPSAIEGWPILQLEFALRADGKLSSLRLAPEALAVTPLGECIKRAASETTFPTQGKAVSFAIPLSASPAGPSQVRMLLRLPIEISSW